MAIQFFEKEVRFQLPHPRKTTSWLRLSAKKERKSISALSIVFCSDQFLSGLNLHYLKHNTLTDILTFDLSEGIKPIVGEIYISIDRVKENAVKFSKEFDEELHRVMIHGLLHLIGYDDKTPLQKAKMREKEEAFLSLR